MGHNLLNWGSNEINTYFEENMYAFDDERERVGGPSVIKLVFMIDREDLWKRRVVVVVELV